MESATFERELRRFDPDLPPDRSPTPPASWYREPAFLAREWSHGIEAAWQPVVRRDQVARAGEFAAVTLGTRPLVVVRDEQGCLRGLHNVCRHHAAEVARGTGCAEELLCPYHGWTYHLDGSLKRAPGLGRAVDFDPCQNGLQPVHVAEWGPWVWVRVQGPRRNLCTDLQQLLPMLEATQFADLTFVARRSYELACNWKVFVDNYLDGGYHVERVHGDLASELDLSDYSTEIHERFSVQSCRARGEDSQRLGQRALYAWIYPNFMINRYGPIMDTNWVLPLGTDRCLTIFDYYFVETQGDAARRFIDESLAASDRVQQEDIAICESVQRGLASGAYDQGRYGATEASAHHFHRLLALDLARKP